MANVKISKRLSRREFLIRTGWVAAGATVLTSCSGLLPVLPTTGSPSSEDGFLWIQIVEGGRVRFLCPRMEMGQGASLGLSQIVAEELNVDQADIDCVQIDTSQLPPFKMTVGSESIAEFSTPVAIGAANLREAMRRRAAITSGLNAAEVKDAVGGFSAGGKFVSYAELVPREPELLKGEFDSDVRLKLSDANHTARQVGRRWRRPDLRAIVTGQRVFSRDVVAPNMLYGELIRPPRFGAKLDSVDLNGAKALKDVVDVVVEPDKSFVGVVAETPIALATAIDTIDAAWQTPDADGAPDKLAVSVHSAENDFEHTLVEGGNESKANNAAKIALNAAYSTSFMAHAAMEPRAAVVSVTPASVDAWCGCQDPYFIRGRIASLLGRDAEEVVVHALPMGGGFGGRVLSQPAEEAAVLSARVGRPVKVSWTRETEFQQNYYQPMFSHAIDAGLSLDGKIAYWRHDFVSSPIIFGLVEEPLSLVLDAFVADEGTARGALSPYSAMHTRVRYSDIRTEIPIGAWRGLGAAPNTFAIESMIDELALAAGADALRFRLQNLDQKQSRLRRVLQRVGEISPWPQSAEAGAGLGIACAVYKGETPVAVVAEVRIDHRERDIKVTRLWCAQDCGLVINPDQVENQILGNLMWGCGLALKEKMTFSDGVADQTNFDAYEILRHLEAPAVVMDLIDAGSDKPVGVGEAALPPVAAAIANAVFAASGIRPRQLPFNYDNLIAQN